MGKYFSFIYKFAAIPLFFLVLYGSLAIMWNAFNLPKDEEFIGIVKNFIHGYGVPLVFLSAILEGLLFVGNYFPGSFVIFISVAAASDVYHAILSVVLTTIAFTISYSINYFLGRFGWHKILLKFGLMNMFHKVKEDIESGNSKLIFLSYSQPAFATFTSTIYGVLRTPYKKFMSITVPYLIVWNTVWGLLAYYVGEKLLLAPMYVIVTILIIWVFFALYKNRKAFR